MKTRVFARFLFSISHKYQGQGYMTEMLKTCLNYVFTEVGLHWVIANYLPQNKRNEAVLINLGFEKEGYARSNLKNCRKMAGPHFDFKNQQI